MTGALIAGGKWSGNTAEFYLPGLHCKLPDLPAGHYKARHVQVDNVLGGGFGDNIEYKGKGCLRQYLRYHTVHRNNLLQGCSINHTRQ